MEKKEGPVIDIFGIAASLICILHCLLSSFALAILPQYGRELWRSDFTHQSLAALAMLFCLGSIYQINKRNNNKASCTLFTIGLILLFTATFILPEAYHEQYEVYLLAIGGSALVIGHIWNVRKLCCCAA